MPFNVYLNVYDMVQYTIRCFYLYISQTDRNKYIYPLGLGVYHSGVEINDIGTAHDSSSPMTSV